MLLHKLHPYYNTLCIRAGGVFPRLELLGVTLPSDSFVNFNDIPQYSDDRNPNEMNRRETLFCRTDLTPCCNPPEVGEWYYPDGSPLVFDAGGTTFRRNRGTGVVRLWRRGNPPERGRFRCEIPNAANPNVNQTLYVNICELRCGQTTV